MVHHINSEDWNKYTGGGLKKKSFILFLYHLSCYRFNIFFVKFLKMCQDKCFDVFLPCLYYFRIAGISSYLWIYTH